MRAVIASGSGRYADPWHPFAATSALVADVLRAAGFVVSIVDDVDVAMTQLDGVDLLVVNAGDPWRGGANTESAGTESVNGLDRAFDRGIGLLALHCAVSSMRDYPSWFATVGGMWVPSLSHHPPADETTITICSPVASKLPSEFQVFDERYCRIQRIGPSTTVARHRSAAGWEPTAWVREVGRSRVAVDLLGHDERSYESEGHRALLSGLAHWTVQS